MKTLAERRRARQAAWQSMSLKDQVERKIRIHTTAIAIDLAILGVATGFAVSLSGLTQAASIAWAALTLLSLLGNAYRIREIRLIRRSPLFFLLAVRHDLGQHTDASL